MTLSEVLKPEALELLKGSDLPSIKFNHFVGALCLLADASGLANAQEPINIELKRCGHGKCAVRVSGDLEVIAHGDDFLEAMNVAACEIGRMAGEKILRALLDGIMVR